MIQWKAATTKLEELKGLSLSVLGESGHRVSTAEGILCMLGYEARDVICIANSQMCAI